LSGGAPEPASLAVCVLMPSSTVEPKGNSSSFSGPCQWNVHPPDWYDSESAVGPVTKMVERPLASVNGNRWSLLRSSTTDSLPRTPICVRDGERVSRRRGFHSLRLQWRGSSALPGVENNGMKADRVDRAESDATIFTSAEPHTHTPDQLQCLGAVVRMARRAGGGGALLVARRALRQEPQLVLERQHAVHRRVHARLRHLREASAGVLSKRLPSSGVEFAHMDGHVE